MVYGTLGASNWDVERNVNKDEALKIGPDVVTPGSVLVLRSERLVCPADNQDNGSGRSGPIL